MVFYFNMLLRKAEYMNSNKLRIGIFIKMMSGYKIFTAENPEKKTLYF